MSDLRFERDAAKADMARYHTALGNGWHEAALAIEEAWGLAGFPPEIVSGCLAGVTDGKTIGDTLDEILP